MAEVKAAEIPEEVCNLAQIILSPRYDGFIRESARKKLERIKQYIEDVLQLEESRRGANLSSN